MFNGLFDIVFFALVAAFLAFKLYNVLGRKDDNNNSSENLSNRWKNQQQQKGLAGNVVTLPIGGKTPSLPPFATIEPAFSESLPATLTPVLEAINNADSNFTEQRFLKGVQSAFELILTAFAKGDKATLEPLLSADIYKDFIEDIKTREQNGEQLDITVVAILNTQIADATLKQGVASVTVQISSEQIIVTRNKEGEIIAGNPSHIDVIEDSWTFSRTVTSSNPNWKLVSTNHIA